MRLFCSKLFCGRQWHRDQLLSIDSGGIISGRGPGSPAVADHCLPGPVIPGMANLHSHAFQRVFAGLTGEVRLHRRDSFWSWRQSMYHWARSLNPDQIFAITAYCFMELLQGGYTSVAEFHYLHRSREGENYADAAATSLSIVEAASQSGISITLLPVFYARSGFGADGVLSQQQGFKLSLDQYLQLLQRLQSRSRRDGWVLGVAPHSLRAVSEADLKRLLTVLSAEKFAGPIHIHIAEQQQEVEDCRKHLGQRPVQWLLDTVPVDSNWCLVHATHMDAGETAALAASGAVAGLCPTTEADLGDGIFPMPQFIAGDGSWGIGSDSNLRCDAAEELRLLEWTQRLLTQQRNLLHNGQSQLGTGLYQQALRGGRQALSQPVGELNPGYHADLVVLDEQLLARSAADEESVLDQYLFAQRPGLIKQVWCRGRLLVENGRHIRQDEIQAAYHNATGSIS